MIQKVVAGFVLVALIAMVVLAYAQKHEGCLHGRSLQSLKPCGSIGVEIGATDGVGGLTFVALRGRAG